MCERRSPAVPFPEELRRLEEVERSLEQALDEAEAAVERIDREYREEKRYMSQYRGEIDPHEMFQNELALRQIDGSGAFAVKERNRLARLKEAPYFARVDFRADGEEVAAHYIGPFAFRHENELLICDWRSPVAGLFYDCEVGPAGYDAPVGRVEGTLTRKRQFKIRGGEMEYALETSDNIRDDVLQRELSRTSDEKMKSIIATIQREQNRIIRSERTGTMIIQGVAGSGKTSIALHRLAFLLYRHKDTLSAGNVAILSPNKVFGDYISNVLPELGEEPICDLSFQDIARIQLEGVIGFEPDRDPLETDDRAWAERARFKSTLEFVGLLDRYLEGLTGRVLRDADCVLGSFTAGAELIKSRFEAYGKFPVKRRLQMIADDLHSRFSSDRELGDEAPGARTVLKGLSGLLSVKNTLTLYRDFYRWLGRPELLDLPDRKTLEWADVYPFLYLHDAFEGLKSGSAVRHLVVDEMQDYTPVQYAVLNRLFRCDKTILGDFGQSINPNRLSTLEDLRQIYCGARYISLNKSYRSTYEIIRFSARLQGVEALEPVARHGDEPQVLPCAGRRAEAARIGALIDRFEGSGYASMGVIAKTNRDARALYELLGRRPGVRLLTPESGSFSNGVMVTSVQMSKGLEFDEVIVAGADRAAYATEYDRGLLYVACTRAMHRLSLTCRGEPSALLRPGVPPDAG
ncbi:HelD family protein [Pseudoflavonifractor phocaeensis]|uniref:HelD family protein n=1 Tax=Pseudoflavonifractor phocaeensis TaxID=1870988 RepID=UPI00210AEF56|nr:ATP-binding domain-containing protein [Pseudoflavonifractor phocaeensis]MCQ4864440.1 AAA family ATPase [Pseudoflavonifractor phocaeensis]